MQKRYEPMIRSLPPAAIDHLRNTFNLPPTEDHFAALTARHLCHADVVLALLDTPFEDECLQALVVTRVECLPHVPAPHRPPPPDTRPRVLRAVPPTAIPWQGARAARYAAARPRPGMLVTTLLARGMTTRDKRDAVRANLLELG